MQLIKECAENIHQQKLQITQVSSCKFLSAINPIETPRIAIVLSLKETEEGKLQLQAEGTVKEKTVNKSIVKEDELTLLDFLNSLSAEQQKAALVHLSVLWAEQQGGKNGIRAINRCIRILWKKRCETMKRRSGVRVTEKTALVPMPSTA